MLAAGEVDAGDAAGSPPPSTSCWSSGSPRSPDHPGVRRGAARLPARPAAGDAATAEALVAWLGGQPHVAAAARRAAGVKGELDHFAALGFLQGLLTVLRDCGHPGLLLVLDEVETLQRVRGDVREKGLNALRQLIDEVDAGRFPGLYLVITGTPAFYDGPQGVAAAAAARPAAAHRLRHRPPLRQPARGPAPAARLRPRPARSSWVGTVRDLYAGAAPAPGADRGARRRRLRRRAGPGASPASSAARSASPRGCSCRSWSATCSTGSTSSPTSTRAGTTR